MIIEIIAILIILIICYEIYQNITSLKSQLAQMTTCCQNFAANTAQQVVAPAVPQLQTAIQTQIAQTQPTVIMPPATQTVGTNPLAGATASNN